jgi:hypothetical protein
MQPFEYAMAAFQGLTGLVAVGISARALAHSKSKGERDEDRAEVVADKLLAATRAALDRETTDALRDLKKTLERAFTLVERVTDRFDEHERDCIKDKTRLVERQETAAKALESLMTRVENNTRQLGFFGRDIGEARTTAQLLNIDKTRETPK